eukprot:gene12656-9051_t
MEALHADRGIDARHHPNNGLNYCSNEDDALVRAYRLREEIDINNEEMVDEALHPVQDEEVRSCLQDFTKTVGGIRLSDCGKVVVGDFPSPSTDGNDRIHCGCAICGIRCVGREPSNDEEREGTLSSPRIRKLSRPSMVLETLFGKHEKRLTIAQRNVLKMFFIEKHSLTRTRLTPKIANIKQRRHMGNRRMRAQMQLSLWDTVLSKFTMARMVSTLSKGILSFFSMSY